MPDFYFTGDDYRYHFEAEAKQRLLDLLRERFNSGVRYKGRALKWDTVIEQKTLELGRCLAGQTNELDFSEPSPNPSGTDERELRRRILGSSQKEALKLGIEKRAVHHLRKNTRSGRQYKVYRNVRKKLRACVGRVTNPSMRTREGGVSFHD